MSYGSQKFRFGFEMLGRIGQVCWQDPVDPAGLGQDYPTRLHVMLKDHVRCR